jgi:hypothetical protein
VSYKGQTRCTPFYNLNLSATQRRRLLLRLQGSLFTIFKQKLVVVYISCRASDVGNARIWRVSVSDNVIGRTSSRPVYLVICIVFTLSSCCGRLRLHIFSRTLSIFLFCAHNRYKSSYLRELSIYKFDTFSHLVSIVLKSYSIVVLCSFP